MTESVLWIVAESEETSTVTVTEGERGSEDTGGGYGPVRSGLTETVQTIAKRKRIPLDAQALKTQMDGLLSIVGDLFSQADQQTGMRLEEVELSVEINAEGQLSLVGNGGKLGNTGGITLKFVRPDRTV